MVKVQALGAKMQALGDGVVQVLITEDLNQSYATS